jgi:hypothetical protein
VAVALFVLLSVDLELEPAMIDGEHKCPFVTLMEVVWPMEVHLMLPSVFPHLAMHVLLCCVDHNLSLFWSRVEMKGNLKIRR